MKDLERLLKAMANKRRLSILKFLRQHNELSVGDIAERIQLSIKSTSRHLSVLAGADIVEKEQRSTSMFYRLAKIEKQFLKNIFSEIS
ncbi:MAG: metalloregulator ArsR/SmtB family transcription factor [Patescibacteria group bacterium]